MMELFIISESNLRRVQIFVFPLSEDSRECCWTSPHGSVLGRAGIHLDSSPRTYAVDPVLSQPNPPN